MRRKNMLYPHKEEPKLKEALFRAPSSEYRGTPFWAWNGKLDDATLGEQIDMLQRMGLGGFHMHVRTGMDAPYLDKTFMGHIRYCVQRAKEKGMLAWLYDEDRWPSGAAGGIVTANHPEYAMQYLLFTTEPYAEGQQITDSRPGWGQQTLRRENGRLLAVYDIVLNADGTLRSACRVGKDDPAQGTKWYAYVEHTTDDPWFNDHPYVDLLNREAVAEFLRVTYDTYDREFHGDFGKAIPAIFTDEPTVARKRGLAFAAARGDAFIPWTDALPAAFEKRCGRELLEALPELFWELPDGLLSRGRYAFYDVVSDLFADSFCRQIGNWCRAHGLPFTGHLYGETPLWHLAHCTGDAMRCYGHFDIPGMDMLCDRHEYNTAKQVQSIVRQDGKQGMMSELYGVTGWDYDFRGYKLQGDWQAALGVTVRVPHLTWMTMKGEAKRDYPASIGYQSPWWDQFSMVEDHFARLNTALTRGKARVRVAVVHPIETYWLYCGPAEQTQVLRAQLEDQFAKLTEYLLFGLIDFDFLSEAALPTQCPAGGAPLRVGEMAYDAVIVCGCRTLRQTTLDRLAAFQNAGGRLIFIGGFPDYVDAVTSDAVRSVYDRAQRVGFEQAAILNSLEGCRFLDIRTEGGVPADRFLYQHRVDGEAEWLFIANGKNPVSPDVEDRPRYRIALRGEYALTEYDTLTGEIRPLPARYEKGQTIFERTMYLHDSLLLLLEKGRGTLAAPIEQTERGTPKLLLHPVDVTLDEPNMLLLDMAEFALNDGPWQPLEELLRIDNLARAQLGIPLRCKEVVQPYKVVPEPITNHLRLRFTIPSEITATGLHLALEDAAETEITWNGQAVTSQPDGWYVDRSIETVPLPPLAEGENVLEVRVPIGRRTNLECMYLLGDFGVRVNGVEKTVIAPIRRLGFGSVVEQGLPFYTGNVNYHFTLDVHGPYTLRVPAWRGGLVKVLVDGQDAGNIAFSPYERVLDGLAPGKHQVTLKLYGTRQNGFAQLHHIPGIYFYQSPDSWRSTGDRWTYEYQFKPMGILKSPEIYGG